MTEKEKNLTGESLLTRKGFGARLYYSSSRLSTRTGKWFCLYGSSTTQFTWKVMTSLFTWFFTTAFSVLRGYLDRLTHPDIGLLQMYVDYFDQVEKLPLLKASHLPGIINHFEHFSP